MSNEEYVDPETGLKLRKLTSLRKSAAKEYEEAMLKRVDYFAEKHAENSIFNNFLENTLVKGLSSLLEVKTKVDDMLGENKEKMHEVIEKVLLFGL